MRIPGDPGNGPRPGPEPSRPPLAHREEGVVHPGGKMKLLTKVKKACCSAEKAAQCCAKASRLVSGCHD